jgi:tetraspanin-11
MKLMLPHISHLCLSQVGGVTVLGIGIWTLVDKSFMNELLGTNLFLGAVYILIATGAIISLIAFFGCLGALKEIKCMLLTVSQFGLWWVG